MAIVCASVVMAADMKIEHGAISVEIMATSGKMTMTAEESKDDIVTTAEPTVNTTTTTTTTTAATPTTTTLAALRRRRDAEAEKNNVVTVEFDSLIEVNAAGAEVGKERALNPSRLSSFAAVKFTVDQAAKDDDVLMYSKKGNTENKITAVSMAYKASLADGSTVKFMVYIAKEAGNITLNNEVTPVEVGQVKFAVLLEGYKWCTETDANCKNGTEGAAEVGAFIELSMTVTGEGEASMETAVDNMSSKYNIGNGNSLYMSKQIRKTSNADADTWEAMSAGYPKYEKKGTGKSAFTIRIPTFEKSVWYDPGFTIKVPGGNEVGGVSAVAASLSVVMMGLLAALFRL